MSLTLPPELFDSIVDHIDNVVSLKTCALASNALRVPSQKRLFSHVRLLPYPLDGHGASTVLPPNVNWPGSSSRFLDLITSSPHIVSYLTSLHITNGPSRPAHRRTSWLERDRHVPRILDLLSGACRFQSLTISCSPHAGPLIWSELCFPIRRSLCDIAGKLTFLALSDVQAGKMGWDDLQMFLNAALNLRHLSLHAIRLESAPYASVWQPVHLNSLCVSFVSPITMSVLFNRLVWSQRPFAFSLRHLKNFYVRVEFLEQYREMCKVLEWGQNSLEEIEIHVFPVQLGVSTPLARVDLSIWPSPPLDAFPSIRSIKIVCWMSITDPIRWLLEFLRSVLPRTSLTLESVTIEIYLRHDFIAACRAAAFAPLVALLHARCRTTSLSRIVVRALYVPTNDDNEMRFYEALVMAFSPIEKFYRVLDLSMDPQSHFTSDSDLAGSRE